jgi:hypothetical protein
MCDVAFPLLLRSWIQHYLMQNYVRYIEWMDVHVMCIWIEFLIYLFIASLFLEYPKREFKVRVFMWWSQSSWEPTPESIPRREPIWSQSSHPPKWSLYQCESCHCKFRGISDEIYLKKQNERIWYLSPMSTCLIWYWHWWDAVAPSMSQLKSAFSSEFYFPRTYNCFLSLNPSEWVPGICVNLLVPGL